MPRKASIYLCGVASTKTYAPGALHHIIVRGIYRRKIFFDDADRDDFLDRLGGILSESDEGPANRRRARVEAFG